MRWTSFWEKLTNWELWPFKLRYFLISPIWLWYCLRSGSFWFFSSSNPTLTFGGFEGEGKKEMYELLPDDYYPKTVYANPQQSIETVLASVSKAGITYPCVAKPDVGMKGLLFRKLDNEKQLQHYHLKNPFEYIVQDLVEYPLEVSVFYYRYPGQQKGVVSGFIQKELMDIRGNGRDSIWQLIMEHPKARHRAEEMRIKHQDNLDVVLKNDERYILTYAANLNRGAKFTNLAHLIDDDLRKMFDRISHPAQFYYGRYDIKCQSIESLKRGEEFTILEFNGSGAEPNHVYNSGFSLFGAYKVFLHHWKVLFHISRINNKNGVPYWPAFKGWHFLRQAKKHLKQLEQADTEILLW